MSSSRICYSKKTIILSVNDSVYISRKEDKNIDAQKALRVGYDGADAFWIIQTPNYSDDCKKSTDHITSISYYEIMEWRIFELHIYRIKAYSNGYWKRTHMLQVDWQTWLTLFINFVSSFDYTMKVLCFSSYQSLVICWNFIVSTYSVCAAAAQ